TELYLPRAGRAGQVTLGVGARRCATPLRRLGYGAGTAQRKGELVRSSPITEPSSLLWVAPRLRSASVLSPSRLEPLVGPTGAGDRRFSRRAGGARGQGAGAERGGLLFQPRHP